MQMVPLIHPRFGCGEKVVEIDRLFSGASGIDRF
jgi:hypothetical protein